MRSALQSLSGQANCARSGTEATLEMTPADRTAATEAYQAQLAARFALRRCRCGQPATVIIIGQDAVRFAGMTVTKATRDRNSCIACTPWLRREQGREAA